jgi:hypothetical protein
MIKSANQRKAINLKSLTENHKINDLEFQFLLKTVCKSLKIDYWCQKSSFFLSAEAHEFTPQSGVNKCVCVRFQNRKKKMSISFIEYDANLIYHIESNENVVYIYMVWIWIYWY